MRLLQSQKNQVYEVIEESGMSPNMFYFRDPQSKDSSTYLFLKNSKYYFMFTKNLQGSHYAVYSPGKDTFEERQNPGSWELQLNYVNLWLSYLTRELNAPDRWKMLQEEIENANFEDIKYEDTKFTYQEYELLERKINEIKGKIEKLDLMDEQIKKINEKLDHLLHLAKDMNKTDWKELFIGAVISLFMQLSIDKGTGQIIFGYIRGLFVKFLPQV